jgi:hypothetical protein
MENALTTRNQSHWNFRECARCEIALREARASGPPPIPGSDPQPEPDPEPQPGSDPDLIPPSGPVPEPGPASTPDVFPPPPRPAHM